MRWRSSSAAKQEFEREKERVGPQQIGVPPLAAFVSAGQHRSTTYISHSGGSLLDFLHNNLGLLIDFSSKLNSNRARS